MHTEGVHLDTMPDRWPGPRRLLIIGSLSLHLWSWSACLAGKRSQGGVGLQAGRCLTDAGSAKAIPSATCALVSPSASTYGVSRGTAVARTHLVDGA